jgi:acyl-CoA thioesterase-1
MVSPNLGGRLYIKLSKDRSGLDQENNTSLIPFLLQGVAGDEKLNIADGIPPNPAGHMIVAENVLKIAGTLVR